MVGFFVALKYFSVAILTYATLTLALLNAYANFSAPNKLS